MLFGIYGNDVKEVVDALEAMDIIRKVLYGIYHIYIEFSIEYDGKVLYGMIHNVYIEFSIEYNRVAERSKPFF